jgi:hypothetical protein
MPAVTVVAVCRFPWGKMRALAEATGGADEALIFASDTRHTYTGALGAVDTATKIFPFIQSKVLAAYTGEAGVGETCMEIIGERILLDGLTTSEAVGKLAQEVLVEKWPTRAVRNMQLIMVIGLCDAAGHADLIKLGSENGFVPLSLFGAHAIGEPAACETFLARLDRSLDERYKRGAVVAEPRAWATIVGGALYETIKAQPPDSTVGGKIQCYILDAKGIHGWGVSRTRDGQHLDKVSLEFPYADTYKKRHGIRPSTKNPLEWREVDNPTDGGPIATRL